MTTSAEAYPIETAADYASVSALLIVGDRLGIVPHLDNDEPITAARLARAANLSEEVVSNYLQAIAHAGVVSPGENGVYDLHPEYVRMRYEAGYSSWLMNANRPFIEFAREFVETPRQARAAHPRDGREVAISSAWGGSLGFYSVALNTLLAEKPGRVVDLGAGSARLLIGILRKLPETTAVALDIDAAACAEARKNADAANVADRLTVIERSIQSVATDPSPVAGADVVHGGFVFHDMMPDEEETADEVMRNCYRSLNPNGILAITDAVPFAPVERERRFSAAMTYFHHQFMGRRLLTEEEWTEKFTAAGFDSVTVHQHRLPSGRLYVGRKL